jgi:hypothetical protein
MMLMKSRYFFALPPIALLAACGGETPADQGAVVTNTGNVILNDAQADYQFKNDEPVNTLADDAAAMNAMDGGMGMANETMPANGM